MFPVSHKLLLEVAVWATMSLLVHLTVVPTFTERVSGTYVAVGVRNWAPIGIATLTGDPDVGVGVGVVDIGEGELPPQPTTARRHVRRLARRICFMDSWPRFSVHAAVRFPPA